MLPPLTVIFLWPLVMIALFKRLNLTVALCVSIFAGYLLLPTTVGFNLPVLPTINKNSMPSIAAILILMNLASNLKTDMRRGGRMTMPVILPGWLPRHPVALTLFVGLILGALMTIAANGDSLSFGPKFIPGLKLYDGGAAVLTSLVALLPFLLGRKFLSTASSHKTLLFVFCVAGALYSLPTLWEVRMSPQLNRDFYGFFPHSWSQHIRGSGYRPLVFLEHGLWLGIFLSGTVLATLGYIRAAKPENKALYWGIAIWLFGTLVLAKSLGALLITIVLAPVVLFFPIRLQLIAAAVIAGSVLFYPALRGGGIIPTERAVGLAASIDHGRSLSLQYRLRNEDVLLERANQRPLFGWGGRGRARIYDERGRDISTTDGRWIISIGNEGWIGYLGRFGLLTFPILLLAFRQKKYEVTLPTSALCLVLVGNLVDLIPNAGLTPLTWLMAGALMGYLETPGVHQPEGQDAQPDTSAEPTGSRYSRESGHPPDYRADHGSDRGPARKPLSDAPPKEAPRYSRFNSSDDASNKQDK